MARTLKRYPLNSIALRELADDLEKLRSGMEQLPNAVVERATKHAETDFNAFLSAATPGRQAVISTATKTSKRGKYGATGTLTATGKTEHDDEYGDFNILMAVEFGAGIVAAGASNPHYGGLGYGAGSYNLHGHALDPRGWMYPTGELDENGEEIWRHTFGTPAAMPMHRTILDTKANMSRFVAEELTKWIT